MSGPALIVGADGQDGRLLGEHLRRAGRDVVAFGRGRPIDILDAAAVASFVASHKPSEVYYLPAYHHAAEAAPPPTAELLRNSFAIHVDGLINFLEAIRTNSPQTRLFYAASSHVFGDATGAMQNESTPLRPRCAYGVTKTAGVQTCRLYRDAHGVFVSIGILFNHESPLRRPQFVSQKIARAAVAASRGSREKLVLGDLSARIDWGWAPDFVDAMARILALDAPGDFVVATGELHSVRDFAAAAFGAVGLDYASYVEENPSILAKRTLTLVGDASILRAATGWKPSVTFEQMVQALVRAAAQGAGHPQ